MSLKTTGDLVAAADWNSINSFQLATLDLTSDDTFSGISQDFYDLQIRLIARTSNAVSAEFARMRFNGDSSANYYTQRWRVTDTTVQAAAETGMTSMGVAVVAGANANSDFFGSATVDIPGYSSTAYRWQHRSESAVAPSATVSTAWQRNIFQGGRSAVALITSITLLPGAGSFVAGSRATLYGIGLK